MESTVELSTCQICNQERSSGDQTEIGWVCDECWEANQEDPGLCSSCNGSGEGMFDGSRCSSCHGSGEARRLQR